MKNRNNLNLLIVIALLLVVACACPKPDERSKVSTNGSTPVSSNPSQQNQTFQTPLSSWSYRESTDKMTSKPVKFASVDSDNTLDFDFPYQGGSTGTLTIRRKDNKNEVMLFISKGQFSGNALGNRFVRLRFDEKPAINVGFDEPSDNSSTLIFLNSEEKIINELKKASVLKVEAEFY